MEAHYCYKYESKSPNETKFGQNICVRLEQFDIENVSPSQLKKLYTENHFTICLSLKYYEF